MAHSVEVRWSVWDVSPTVRWNSLGAEIEVTLEQPPVAVINLPLRNRIAIATAPDQSEANELRLYSYDGKVDITVPSTATNLPRCQFLFARELPTGEIEAGVCYEGAPWGTDHAGILDLQTGSLCQLHPIR